jgi:hypothetical protein
MKHLLYISGHGELIHCKECKKIIYWTPKTIDGFCSINCRQSYKEKKDK